MPPLLFVVLVVILLVLLLGIGHYPVRPWRWSGFDFVIALLLVILFLYLLGVL